MKYKLVHILVTLGLVSILCEVDAFSKGCPGKNIETSAHNFIIKYYNELLGEGDESSIRQYYLKPLDNETLDILDRAGYPVSRQPLKEEDFKAIIEGSRKAQTEKFDLRGIRIISKKPLIIGVRVYETNKSELHSGQPFDEWIYVLKDIDECNWKIVDVISPYMP